MDRNVYISLEERIRMAMDALDEISMLALREKNSNIVYDINSAYSDLRSAYLKIKSENPQRS